MSFGYEPNGHEGLTLWSHQFDRVSKCACFGRSEFDEYARTNGIFFPARCFAVDHMRMEKEFEMRHRKTQMDLFHCQTISRTGVPIFKKQQSFPQFALLPMEIQQLIWKFSLPGPETIKLIVHGKPSSPKLRISRSGGGNPVALYVCNASRRIALKRYQLSLGSTRVYASLKEPDCDILYFGTNQQFGSALAFVTNTDSPAQSVMQEIKSARRIALNWQDQEAYGGGDLMKCGSKLRKQLSTSFHNLKEVFLTSSDTEPRTSHLKVAFVVEVILDEERQEGFEEDEAGSRGARMLSRRAQKIADGFNTVDLSKEEKLNGIPKATIAPAVTDRSRVSLHITGNP